MSEVHRILKHKRTILVFIFVWYAALNGQYLPCPFHWWSLHLIHTSQHQPQLGPLNKRQTYIACFRNDIVLQMILTISDKVTSIVMSVLSCSFLYMLWRAEYSCSTVFSSCYAVTVKIFDLAPSCQLSDPNILRQIFIPYWARLTKQATLESFVTGSILIGFKNNGNERK